MDSALETAGKAAFPDFTLEVVTTCSSTQDLALQKAAQGAPEGFCVVAMTQTAGRGRQGRGWVAPPGSSLLCSMVLKPADELRPLLTLLAGVVVAEAVAQLASVEVGLKWPNDVLVDGKKLAGILAEARPGSVTLGIGVNLSVDYFPADVRANSLHLVAKRTIGWEEMLVEILNGWRRWGLIFEKDGFGCIVEEWRRRAIGLGAPVSAVFSGQLIQGIAIDIQNDGALLLRTEAGVQALYAGDVHLVAQPS